MSTEDRSIPAIIARLRDGDSDGDDHDMAANEIERLTHQCADRGVRLREAIALVKLYAPTKHWAWILEVESELADDVLAHQHSFVMGVCSCGERSADYLHY